MSNGPPGERQRRGRGRRPRPSPGRRNAAHGGPCAALSDGRGSGRAARRRDPAAGRPAARPGTIPPGGTRAGASRRPGFFRLSGCRRLACSSPGSTRLHWGASEEDALRSQVGTRSLATRRIFQWGPLEMVIDPPRPGAGPSEPLPNRRPAPARTARRRNRPRQGTGPAAPRSPGPLPVTSDPGPKKKMPIETKSIRRRHAAATLQNRRRLRFRPVASAAVAGPTTLGRWPAGPAGPSTRRPARRNALPRRSPPGADG